WRGDAVGHGTHAVVGERERRVAAPYVVHHDADARRLSGDRSVAHDDSLPGGRLARDHAAHRRLHRVAGGLVGHCASFISSMRVPSGSVTNTISPISLTVRVDAISVPPCSTRVAIDSLTSSTLN